MAVEKLKTTKNNKSVPDFVSKIEDKQKMKDTKEILKIFKEITGRKPKMWGPSIIGFGEYKYKRSNGKEFSFLRTGMSPRKNALTIYVLPGYDDYSNLLQKLGPHKKGKSCLYIKNLEDVDTIILKKIIEKGWKEMNKRYPS